MISQLATSGLSLYKRSVEEGKEGQAPPAWVFPVLLLNLIIFIPISLYLSYTLRTLYPALAAIEHPNPPAYERVSLNEEAQSVVEDNAIAPTAEDSAVSPKPVSASLRALGRLLRSVGGWRANFRGFWCSIAHALGVSFFHLCFSGILFVPASVGVLIGSLAFVQLSTAWTHIVISPPHAAPFYRRLPPLRKTFEATCFPILALWLATTLATEGPLNVARLLGVPIWDPKQTSERPTYHADDAWKATIAGVLGLIFYAVTVIPAHVTLTRVQASLLPPEEDTIVAFDRSFGNTVEPAVAGGKGFVTMKNAFKSVSRDSWIRIYILHAKVVAVSIVVYAAMIAAMIPEFFLIFSSTSKDDDL